jgi:hypothetical protein
MMPQKTLAVKIKEMYIIRVSSFTANAHKNLAAWNPNLVAARPKLAPNLPAATAARGCAGGIPDLFV